MFSNIGKKLMGLAKVCAWLTFISSIILFFFTLNNSLLESLIWFVAGALSFLSFWPLYGFGQLIDDVHAIRNQVTSPATQNDELPEL